MRILLVLALSLMPIAAMAERFPINSPSTTNNDDSCDVTVLPAATLLLPYFEVDVAAARERAATTLVTILNVSPSPQIAQLTLWTNMGYPVLSVPLFLTGYDVHTIDFYDLLANGTIGTASATNAPGARSLPNSANAGFLPSAASACAAVPSRLPASLAADARSALTTGRVSSGCATEIAAPTPLATGYATIDVVATCDVRSVADGEPYFRQLLFDNVLSGEYHLLTADRERGNFAGGSPMVHIRAVPEGGPAGTATATNLPYTFYDRFTNLAPGGVRTFDRRQPLPTRFAARVINGGPGVFETVLNVWHEGLTPGGAACTAYAAHRNALFARDLVHFDEHENPKVREMIILSPWLPPPMAPLTVRVPAVTPNMLLPPPSSPAGDVGGWHYLNLDNGGSPAYSTAPGRDFATTNGPRPGQAWVTISMRAEGRYAVEMSAAAIDNGCTAPAAVSSIREPFAPGGNVTP